MRHFVPFIADRKTHDPSRPLIVKMRWRIAWWPVMCATSTTIIFAPAATKQTSYMLAPFLPNHKKSDKLSFEKCEATAKWWWNRVWLGHAPFTFLISIRKPVSSEVKSSYDCIWTLKFRKINSTLNLTQIYSKKFVRWRLCKRSSNFVRP